MRTIVLLILVALTVPLSAGDDAAEELWLGRAKIRASGAVKLKLRFPSEKVPVPFDARTERIAITLGEVTLLDLPPVDERAAFRQRDRGQNASEYGMLMVMIALVVVSGAIFFGRSVRQSMQQASECIEYASSAEASASASSQGAAARQVDQEKKSGSLADRLAALLATREGGNEADDADRAAAGNRGNGVAQNPGKCPE